ncbi:Oxysterol-binding protein-related protein 9 [Halotydeus destructor]|nr:Oxysterol-binding protein-related protein 9 [Halotydeus destructor]
MSTSSNSINYKQAQLTSGKLRKQQPTREYNIKCFERKLSEADAYLQLLIKQVKEIDHKIQSSDIEEEKVKLVDIKAKTLLLLDKIKLTIVSLQIAKNTVVPEEDSAFVVTEKSIEDEDSLSSSDATICDIERRIVHENIHIGKEVPLIPGSCSTSEDEDEFEDALEDAVNSSPSKNKSNGDMSKGRSYSIEQYTNANGIDYDKIYEEDEVELDSLDGQGSVISHLISQVKIGMDLTKVVLPTFILERRSLLEMYADFFAHPDLFVSIADGDSAEDRFLRVVKWYLSAFHAGRKSSVAKKPYNPVLGETFKCYWDVPNYSSSPEQDTELAANKSKKLVEDGPIPWASTSNLTFTAEQVSHHPPISAFYAEHIERKIICSASIYTKSAFLGLSIGVHHIGHGSITLLDRDEEYTVSFPSAYGRSILTVPWIELGGNVAINCAKTGYSASIDFLTKPFYGGKKHKVSGDVYNPNKKVILSITGEWNGTMNARRPETGKSEHLFVDTKTIPIIKKIVQPVAKQEEYESRNLWKEVTVALKTRDVSQATAAKSKVEQRQRDLVKKRSQDGSTFQNRLFHQEVNRWLYNNPLPERHLKLKS